MKEFFKKIIKIILVIVVIWLIVIFGNKIVNRIKIQIDTKNISRGFDIKDAKEYKSIWKNTMSDIDSMTVWEKYEKGLAVNNGSDTDGDGLTDKEEIEIYGSNPLKVSTAGDLYTDAYKVGHEMDVNKFYDYSESVEFPYNECPEVLLTAAEPTDFNAVVRLLDKQYRLNGCKIFAGYKVYNYSGELAIDLTEILNKNDVNGDDICVYLFDGESTKKYGSKVSGTTISLKKKLDKTFEYEIYLVEKSIVCDASMLFGNAVVTEISEETVTGAGLVLDCPILTLFGRPVDITYEDLGDDEKNQILRDKVVKHTKDCLGDDDKYYSEDAINKDSAIVINAKYEVLKNIIPFFDITNKTEDELGLLNIIFLFYSYEDREAYLNGFDTKEEKPEVTGFAINELPFSNFKSEYGTTGNCAGISHLTAFLYNTGSYNSSGSYTQDGYNISWNLENDEDNATLMNLGLYDYKTDSFIADKSSKDNYLNASSLSDGEYEFVKMIGAAYLSGNKKVNNIYQSTYGGVNGNHVYDYSLVEEMMSQLDSGKILDVYFSMNDGSGHTVNIYEYNVDSSDDSIVWFSVYDSNFPGDNVENKELSDFGFKLKTEKRKKLVGDGETFNYEYSPIKNSSYGATSNRAINSTPMMIVLDENWNDLNPSKLVQDTTKDFTISEDNNSFTHTQASFFNSDEKAHYNLDDEYYERLIAHASQQEINIIKRQRKAKEWGGSCYGIASTMGLLYDGEIGVFDLTDGDAVSYYELGLPCEDTKFRNMIHYYQLSQFLETSNDSIAISKTYNFNGVIKNIANWKEEGDSVSEFLKLLVEHTKDEPVLLEFSYEHSGIELVCGFIGGHAILALDCEETEDGFLITLYDENKKNDKITMTIAGDYQSFSFVDGNGNELNQDSYVSMKFKDFDTLYNAVNNGSSLKNRDTTIIFAADSEFSIEDADGNCLVVDEGTISGDLQVNGFDVIAKDEFGYLSDIVIKTNPCEKYVVNSISESIDIIVSTEKNFYSIEGSNIEEFVIDDGTIESDGENYDFDISISTTDEGAVTELVEYSGEAQGKIEVYTEKNKALIKGEDEIKNLTAFNYGNDKVYENLKPKKDGEYYISAKVNTNNLKYVYIGIVVLMGMVVSILIIKKIKS